MTELENSVELERSMCLYHYHTPVHHGGNYLAKETMIQYPFCSSSSACPHVQLAHDSCTLLLTLHTITATHVDHSCGVVLLRVRRSAGKQAAAT